MAPLLVSRTVSESEAASVTHSSLVCVGCQASAVGCESGTHDDLRRGRAPALSGTCFELFIIAAVIDYAGVILLIFSFGGGRA